MLKKKGCFVMSNVKRKIAALLLSVITVLSMSCVAFAGEIPVNTNTYSTTEYEYLDDGSYIVTTITEVPSESLARATVSKSGTKTATCKSSSGTALWSVSVTGSFTYNGSSASCKSASVKTKVYDSSWSISSESAKKSGASAIATAKAKLSGTSTYKTLSVTLTCGVNGTLS